MSVFFISTEFLILMKLSRQIILCSTTSFISCLKYGIYLPPSGYETYFISDAIKDKEIDMTLEAVRKFEYS